MKHTAPILSTSKPVKRSTMKELPILDRPREKLERYGPGKLSNEELLCLLLRSGKHGESAKRLAQKLLKRFPNESLADARYEDLCRINGIGQVKACEIIACFELGRRIFEQKKERLFLSPEDIWREMRDVRGHRKEHVVVFYLDSRSRQIERHTVSVGTLDKSIVHPREVFENAVKCMASHIIVAHNHPSGDPEPSDIDISITRRLAEAGEILGIRLMDHVIVTADEFTSMKAKGYIHPHV